MKNTLFIFLLTCLFLILQAGNLAAQTDITNTGTLYISASSDTVYMGGSFTNTAPAAFTNNSVLNIKQHLSNSQAAMSSGSGTLYLNGGTAQTVSGSQVFKTNNLITNNASGFTLNNNLSVSGVHNFTSGIITTSATPNYLIYEAGASYTGSNDSRHVNGWVKKLGNTAFTFPVGNGTYERPLTLGSIAAASEYAVKYNLATTPDNTSLYGELVLVTTEEYWNINRISGSTATVTLNWDNTKVPIPQVGVTDLRVSYYDGTFWRSIGGPGTGDITTTGTVTSASTNIFNAPFTIGSTANLLPLQLIRFTAVNNNSVNSINWSVTNETGTEKYMLQRSDDGINFYTVATKYAAARGSNSYHYNDAAFTTSKIYYRLKYLNGTGAEKYSSILTVTLSAADSKNFYLLKNPIYDKIDFYASSGYKGKYIYTLTGSSGQVVQSGVVDITAGGIYSIPVRNTLSSGIYVLLLQSQGNTIQKSIYKQ